MSPPVVLFIPWSLFISTNCRVSISTRHSIGHAVHVLYRDIQLIDPIIKKGNHWSRQEKKKKRNNSVKCFFFAFFNLYSFFLVDHQGDFVSFPIAKFDITGLTWEMETGAAKSNQQLRRPIIGALRFRPRLINWLPWLHYAASFEKLTGKIWATPLDPFQERPVRSVRGLNESRPASGLLPCSGQLNAPLDTRTTRI
jgi:hypothetical protein